MFREMRRADRELTEAETEEILKNGEYGILSTVGEDGYPYGTPVSFVYRDQKLYFHCARGVGQKLDNIGHSAKVCFTVVGKTQVLPEKFSTKYESAVVFGLACTIGGEEKQQALEALLDKYSPEYREAGLKYIHADMDKTDIVEITVEHMTGKARK